MSIMREGVHQVVYTRERLEFGASHFFHANFGVLEDLPSPPFGADLYDPQFL